MTDSFSLWVNLFYSLCLIMCDAIWDSMGGQSATPDSKKIAKNQEKE